MKLILAHRLTTQAGVCPYRVIDEQGHEIAWANDFLDARHMRQLSPRSLRAYAYDLLHFARWFQGRPQAPSEITESTLLDYVRHQLNQQPPPTPQTVNHRLTVIRCLYRFRHGQEIPAGHAHFQRIYTTRCPIGYGRPYRAVAFGLRLKQPRRVIQPLSAEQVAKFWASFRTFRDFAVVGAHRPWFVTRPVARWLERHLDFPNWTGADIAALPVTHSGKARRTAGSMTSG